jgi:D-alanyl-D-alanine carboxypeptidase
MRKLRIVLAIAVTATIISSSRGVNFGQNGREQSNAGRRMTQEDRSTTLRSPAANQRGKMGEAVSIEELDAYLKKAADEDSFSGVVLVAKDAQPVFKKAYGMANQSTHTPNNLETKFNLGSMNKMFTAVAIAQLAERGKLSFNDTISKHLPGYPNKAVAAKVTIHHLLTHTSGMGDYFNDDYFARLNRMRTVADLLPLFVNDTLAFEPGTKWQYSNSGYVVLGLIIEKVSGQSYFDYVKEEIFRPAGMTDTDFYERDENVPNRAIGYTKMGANGQSDPAAPRRDNTSLRPAKGSPAGGGYSTAEDLLKFSLALRSHKLLSQKYTDIVITGKVEVGGVVGKYAYGFGDKIFDGKHIVGHNGGGPGIAANLDMFPEIGYTAVLLSNYDPPAMMPVIMKLRGLIPNKASAVPGRSQK